MTLGELLGLWWIPFLGLLLSIPSILYLILVHLLGRGIAEAEMKKMAPRLSYRAAFFLTVFFVIFGVLCVLVLVGMIFAFVLSLT